MTTGIQNQAGQLLQRVTGSWVKVFDITWRDGTTNYKWAAHDRTVTGFSSPFVPPAGLTTFAIRKEQGFRRRATELEGLIGTDANDVQLSQIHQGRWRDATVLEFLTDWRKPWMNPAHNMTWRIMAVERRKQKWRFQLTGVASFLEQKTGFYYQRKCSNELGVDNGTTSFCSVDLSGDGGAPRPQLRAIGVTVSAITDRRTFEVQGAALDATNHIADYFHRGRVTFNASTGGNNKGLSFAVERNTAVSGSPLAMTVTLYDAPRSAIELGDVLDVVGGCNKTPAQCQSGKFKDGGNFDEFKGFPFIPGRDKTLLTGKAT